MTNCGGLAEMWVCVEGLAHGYDRDTLNDRDQNVPMVIPVDERPCRYVNP